MDRIIRIKLDSRQAEQGIDRLDNDMRGLGRTAGGLQTKISGVAAAISAVIGGVAIQRLGQLSDSWTRFGNSVRQASSTIEQFNAIQEALYRIAQDGRVEVEGVADAFVRIDRSVAQFGFSQRDTINVVEGLTKAFAASGATAQEVSSVLVQLGQGLGAGALQGEELRAVLEASIPVSEAIAKGFGVTTGQLKKLGAEGKLTTDRVFVALQKALPEFQSAFDKAVPTIAQGATVAGNAITKFVGEFEKITGIGAAVSQSLIDLAGGFDLLTDAVSGGQLSAVTSSYSRQISQVREEFAKLIDIVSSIPGELSESLTTADNDFVRISQRIVSVIGQALDSVLFDIDLTFDATANYGGSTAKLLQEAFLNIIPNIRAAVQVATVEISALLDAVAAQSTLGVKAIFSDEAQKALDDRLSTIESAKQSTINAILAERQADADATKSAIQNSKDRTAQLKLERDQRAGNVGADPLGVARPITASSAIDGKKKKTKPSQRSDGDSIANSLDRENELIDSALALRLDAYRLYGATINDINAGEFERQRAQLELSLVEQTNAATLAEQSEIARIEARRQQIFENTKLSADEKIEIGRLLDEQLLLQEQTTQQSLTEINAEGVAARQQLAEHERQTRLMQLGQLGDSLMSLGQGQSKRVFEIGKKLSLAQAAIALPTAVMESFKNGGGYPWGLAPAAAMAATGLKNIQNIRSTTYGGGNAGSVALGSGSGSSGGSSSLPTSPQSAPTVQTLEISGLDEIRDELRNQDGMVSTRFVATILDKISDANRIRGEG
jgi:tape measure domain-containing protein